MKNKIKVRATESESRKKICNYAKLQTVKDKCTGRIKRNKTRRNYTKKGKDREIVRGL